jgi:membrane-associated protein
VFAGSVGAYVLIAALIAGSAVFPPLPSEGALVTAMSLAAAGELDLAAVCATAASGAVLGDVTAYSVGRWLSGRVRAETARSTRGQAALRWLEAHERVWGAGLIVTGRFIPGGTTAVGISAGLLVYPLRRFVLFAALGAVLWTGYGVALGFFGAAVFPASTWAGVLLAIGIALGAGAVLAAVRTRRTGARPGSD